MSILNRLSVGVAALGLMVGTLSVEAGTVVDDFESYKRGQKIGDSFDSTPWMRFGNATNDNIVATTDSNKVISGRKSAQYGLFWPNKFGAARFHYSEPTDLTKYTKATIRVKSNYAGTSTKVKIAVSDGEATFHSRQEFAVTDQSQQVTFSLLESDMILVDGKGAFEDTIKKATNIGVDFKSTSGQYVEVVIFDDFELVE